MFDFDALPEVNPAWHTREFTPYLNKETTKEVIDTDPPSEGDSAEGANGQAPAATAQSWLPGGVCEGGGFGFDFDDLPTLPSTFYDPRNRGFSASDENEFAQPPPAPAVGVDDAGKLQQQSPGDSLSPTASTRSSASAASAGEQARPLQPLPLQRRTFQSRPKASAPGCRVAVVINGSLGDVQPLAALALELQLFGHTVRIFTTSNLVDFCKARGLSAVPVFADSKAVISGFGGYNDDFHTCVAGGKKLSQAWIAENKSCCLDLVEELQQFQPQALVCGIMALTEGFLFEAKTGVPFIPVYLSYDAITEYWEYLNMQSARPSILAVSPFLETRTFMDPPTNLQWTDEFVLHEVPSKEELEPGGRLGRLKAFLTAGKPPVAMGWGSMVASGMSRVAMLGLALRALRGAGARGVIIGGWAGLDDLASDLQEGRLAELGEDAGELADFASGNVCFVSSAPHEWLFAQCSSIVHHGGVGTWQAAVRAGKPSIVTPIFADQFSHSGAIGRLGVGIGFKKGLQEVEAHELANAITLVEAKRAAAEAIGRKMRTKVGERDAANVIDGYLKRMDKA